MNQSQIIHTISKVAVLFVLSLLLMSSLSSSPQLRQWDVITVNAFQYQPSFTLQNNHRHSIHQSMTRNDQSHPFCLRPSLFSSFSSIAAITHGQETNVVSRRTRSVVKAATGNADVVVSSSSSSSTNVLVIGGTSGIGQLVTQKLANSNHPQYTVRATSRSKIRGDELFPNNNNNNIEVVELDLLQEDTTQLQIAMEGVSVIVISVGTTAFPTIKWKGGNTPVAIDNIAVTRMAQMASQVSSVRQVILVTSIGVERTNVMPFLILNLFGVLDAKRAGEDAIRQYSTRNTGYQYSIVRPGRLVGGPFTNLDIAKLLQIQGGTENGVTITREDTLLGDCKRDACAECIVQCIVNHHNNNKSTTMSTLGNLEFSIISNDQPALNDSEWIAAFQSVA